MTTLFECDWCGDVVEAREHVASADVTIGGEVFKFHLCVGCAPDHLRPKFPDDA